MPPLPPLRVGFDMDGVLADFETAYKKVEARLFGPEEGNTRIIEPERRAEQEEKAATGERVTRDASDSGVAVEHGPPQPPVRRKMDLVWKDIESTENFWLSLRPLDSDAVRRIQETMIRLRWEVFFITQRPATAGETVQRQSQKWLVEQGFELPSVLVVPGSRGKAAGALHLDYLVDDNPQNCVDVIADSAAKPILILPQPDELAEQSARKLGIGVASSIGECLDVLEQASNARTNPGLLARIARKIGWKIEGAR